MTPEDAFRYFMPGDPPPVTECWMWRGPRSGNGYGDTGTTSAHRVSYELFNGTIATGQLIRHTCDTPACVQPAHLLTGTPLDNVQDMRERGRNVDPPFMPGSKHPKARITELQALEIRRLYAMGELSQYDLADMFKIGQMSISRIVRRETWKHI